MFYVALFARVKNDLPNALRRLRAAGGDRLLADRFGLWRGLYVGIYALPLGMGHRGAATIRGRIIQTMKNSKPIFKDSFIPTWQQEPNYLAKRFAEIREQQREREQEYWAYKLEKISKVRAMTRSGR